MYVATKQVQECEGSGCALQLARNERRSRRTRLRTHLPHEPSRRELNVDYESFIDFAIVTPYIIAHGVSPFCLLVVPLIMGGYALLPDFLFKSKYNC